MQSRGVVSLNDRKMKILVQVLLVMAILFLFIKIQPFILPILQVIGMLIAPIIIGGFLYYALRPIKRLLFKWIGKDSLAALISIILVLALVVILFIYGGAVVKDQFEDAFVKNKDQLTQYKDYLNGKFQEILPDLNIFERINNNIKEFLSGIGSNALGIFSSVGDIVTQFILTPFILFYLLKDDKMFKEKLFSKIPKKHKGELEKLANKIDVILSTYINGQLLVASVIGVLMFIAYLIIGMPNALLMALFSLLTSVIPLIGPFLGVLPALLIALTIDFGLAIKIVIAAIIVQQLEGSFITPKIMGDKLKLHPLAVIVIVIVSIKLFGILGAFIGTPLFLVTVNIIKTLYKINKSKTTS
jgi:predicted PurR-regulated permease PerM